VKQETPAALAHLDVALARLEEQGLLRKRDGVASAGPSFCSNDYLALAHRPAPPAESGAGASRLLGGERAIHAALEAAAADHVGHADALVFSSGYAANVGLLSALARPGDVIVSDALNHASIIDGARLSRARVEVVPHLDLPAVERALAARRDGHAFVVTESYFSMDADSPDLQGLRRLCDRHGAALVVDEAHALGVLGPDGRGLCVAAGVEADVLVGTFGKAFGASGAFAAGCRTLVKWLWNRARSFVFSTGVSPVLAAAALDGLSAALREPWRRERASTAGQQLREGLRDLGLTVRGYGHVVPWVLGDAGGAVRMARKLREVGLDARAVRPPSVPNGTARIRLTATAAHTSADIERAVSLIQGALEGTT
jgi:8-amino-7-oxononanoate synthase